MTPALAPLLPDAAPRPVSLMALVELDVTDVTFDGGPLLPVNLGNPGAAVVSPLDVNKMDWVGGKALDQHFTYV